MNSVYLDAIAYVVGDPVSIDDLPECRDSATNREVLHQEGYGNILVCHDDIEDMAVRSLQRTLANSGLAPGEIDILLFASDSGGDQRERECNSRVHRLCMRLKLENAYPIGINQSTCGNFCSALRVAAALLQAGEARNILLVTVDKSENGSRVMDNNAAVLSDGAASCLVSRSESGRYRLLGITQACSHPLGGEGEAGAKVFLALDGFQQAFESFIARHGLDRAGLTQLIPNNYNLTLLTLYSQIARIDLDKIYTGNLGVKGHVYAGDNLINLADYAGSAVLRRGDRIAMLSNGPSNWGLAALAVNRPS